MVLGNQGGSEMTFASEFRAPTGAPAAPVATSPDVPRLPKGMVDTRVGAAVTRHIGAPDHFGHTWIDSDEPGGPAFQWVDISGIGKKIPFLGDDIMTSRIPIGFSFPFFGGTFDTLRISSNGYISFTSRASDYSNLPLPDTQAPENMIAPYWDDLFAAYFSNTYVHSDGLRMVIEFQDYHPLFADLDERLTFEIILDRSGEFRMQYLSMPGQTNIGTVGFQNASRDDGSLIAFNTPYVHDRLAIRVTSRPAWVTLDPGAGAVSPRGSVNIQAGIVTTGVGTGRYGTTLLLHSNDPVRPVVEVPIELRVLAAVTATAMKISPSTLQTRTGGKQVQAFVELPAALDPTRVVLSSVRFQGTVPSTQMRIGDFDGNGIPDLSFLFDRASVVAALPPGDPVDVTVTGEVQDVALFTGHATVHVVRPRVASTATEEERDLPRVAALHQNRPNPFNPSTSIGFDLPQESTALLTIRTADGRVVRTLIDGRVTAGRRQIVWDGRDDHGRRAASGVYFYKLSAGAYQASRRLVLLK